MRATRMPFDDGWDRAAYEGVEDPANYTSAAAVNGYRDGLLEKTAPQSAFLAAHLPRGGRVFEVACGSGRLLIDLIRKGIAGESLGVDISESRISFARQWAKDLRIDDRRLRLVAASAFDVEPEAGTYDLAVCLTGSLGYFDAIRPQGVHDILACMHGALKPGGWAVIELFNHPEAIEVLERSEREIRYWNPLRATDPFSHVLCRLSVTDVDGAIFISVEKSYLRRGTGDFDTKVEHLRLFRREEILDLAADVGLELVSIDCDWNGTPWPLDGVTPEIGVGVFRAWS